MRREGEAVFPCLPCLLVPYPSASLRPQTIGDATLQGTARNNIAQLHAQAHQRLCHLGAKPCQHYLRPQQLDRACSL